MQIAICDDNSSDVEIIKNYCKQYNDSYSLYTYSSSKALLNAHQGISFDIIFLDIEMEAPNGYDAAKQLTEQGTHSLIIFTTNSLEYSIRGYGIAFRYLPKPITYQMFHTTLSDAETILLPTKIAIQTMSGETIIAVNDILFFESYGHAILFHLTDRQIIEGHGSLSEYIQRISLKKFVQIHKSYCINMDYLSATTNTEVLLKDGTALPIGRRKKEHFFNELHHYMRRMTI